MNWTEMTPEQRDALVAEKIMGWQPTPCDEVELTIYDSGDACCSNCCAYSHISDFEHGEPKPPRYTQSLDAAWFVVEHIFKIEGSVDRRRKFLLEYMQLYLWQKTAPEAAEAICLAALKAVGVEGEI